MADYNLKIIDNKVIFDGHAENPSDCHTLTLLCNLLQKNTKTIDYRAGYAEFELEDVPSENRFFLHDAQTFYINDILVTVDAIQSTINAFLGGTLSIGLSFSQDGVTVHNTGNMVCKVGLFSDLDLDSYFSVTSILSISAGETALLPFLDNIKLRSILSSDGQEISEGDVISDDGTKLTVSKIKSIDLTTLPGWASLSSGSHNITVVAKADGYRDSEPSEGVTVTKEAEADALAGTWVFNDTLTNTYAIDLTYNVNFICKTLNFVTIKIGSFKGFASKNVIYTAETGDNISVYSSNWKNDFGKTITITSKLSEVTDGDTLLAWLQANATKQ